MTILSDLIERNLLVAMVVKRCRPRRCVVSHLLRDFGRAARLVRTSLASELRYTCSAEGVVPTLVVIPARPARRQTILYASAWVTGSRRKPLNARNRLKPLATQQRCASAVPKFNKQIEKCQQFGPQFLGKRVLPGR
jgi:hypothetical protein